MIKDIKKIIETLIDLLIILTILLFPIIIFSIYTIIGFHNIDDAILSNNRVESILFTETNGGLLKKEYNTVHLKLHDDTKLILSNVKLINGVVYYSSLDRLDDYGRLWKFYYDKDIDYMYLWATNPFVDNKSNQKIKDGYLLTSLIDNIDDIKAYYSTLPIASDEFLYCISEKKYEYAETLIGIDLQLEKNTDWHYFLKVPTQYDEWKTKN